MDRYAKRRKLLLIYGLTFVLSLICFGIGAAENGQAIKAATGHAPGAGWIIIGCVLLLWGPALIVFALVRDVLRGAGIGARAYLRWRKNADPRVVFVVETAALLGAHELLKPHAKDKARQERVTSSIVNGTPWQ